MEKMLDHTNSLEENNDLGLVLQSDTTDLIERYSDIIVVFSE